MTLEVVIHFDYTVSSIESSLHHLASGAPHPLELVPSTPVNFLPLQQEHTVNLFSSSGWLHI